MSVSFARCEYAYIYFNLQHDGRLSSDYLGFLHSVSYFFFLYRSPLSSLCMIFNSVSSNIDEVLSINLSGNVFVFGDLIDLMNSVVSLIDLMNSVVNLLSQMTLV